MFPKLLGETGLRAGMKMIVGKNVHKRKITIFSYSQALDSRVINTATTQTCYG